MADLFDPNAFLQGVKTSIDRTSLVASEYIPATFSHPKDNRRPWSWLDHEFQIEIVDCGDNVPELWVTKPAQVGLSTVQIVSALTFLATHDCLKLGYVLPTAKFASEFATMRIDPIINASPVMSSLMGETDNTTIKKVGSGFFVLRGTTGETQAISIDLDALLIDEYNFCNQDVLSTFESRLQHSELKLRRNFSTPTLPDFGVSAGFEAGSQAIRAVFCTRCNTWTIPNFYHDVAIPGFDKPMDQYRKGDHTHPGVKEAYLACPKCRGAFTVENLNNPDLREWVHKHPDQARSIRSYQVMPWDVPKYNPLPEVLADINKRSHQDWVNFRVGLSHLSAENSVMIETVKQYCVLKYYSLTELLRGAVYCGLIGSDLGKTHHYVVGVPNTVLGTLDIVHLSTINVHELTDMGYEGGAYGPFLEKLHIATLSPRTVIDHAPSWEPALYLFQKLPPGQAYGAYYSKESSKILDIYDFQDAKGSVFIERDNHFDDVVAALNEGKIRLPYVDSPHMDVLFRHLAALKKVQERNSKGQAVETWTSTDEDHFAHAIGYLWCAYSSLHGRAGAVDVPMMPGLKGVRMKVEN